MTFPDAEFKEDLGWMRKPGVMFAHYWRSRSGSNLAISPCGEVTSKAYLAAVPKASHCTQCEFKLGLLEDLRPIREVS